METGALLILYPEVFAAGSAFMGIPCFTGTVNKNPREWGDLAHRTNPDHTESWPRIQLWHGTIAYTTLRKQGDQWTSLHALNSPTATDTPGPDEPDSASARRSKPSRSPTANTTYDFRADIFRLMNAATDHCADLPVKPVTGREVVQEPCTGTSTSVWLADPLPNTLYFRLVNQASGICMDLAGVVGNGVPVVQAECSPKLFSQQWQFVFGPVGGPVATPVRVVNRVLGLCLEVKDGSLAEGAPLQVSTCADSVAHQRWLKIDVLGPCGFHLVAVAALIGRWASRTPAGTSSGSAIGRSSGGRSRSGIC